MPYVSIMTPCGRRSPGPYTVAITKTDDATWTKDVIELAEFETREEAEGFRDALKSLLKISKPKKVGVTI